METRAPYMLIGFLTLTIAGGGLLFGLWLAKAGSQQDYRLYDIVFQEAVSGLSVGNAVEYSGIRVGEVKKLWLDPEDPRQVWARVSVTADTPIRENTQARLALANITGTTNIQLTCGSPDSRPLKGAGDQIPRIVAETSPLARLKVTGEEMFVSINALIDNGKRLLSEENINNVGKLLANLETATSAIAEQKNDINLALKDLALTSHQAREVAGQAAGFMSRMNGLLDSHGSNLAANAGKTMVSLERVSAKLDHLLDKNGQALGRGMQSLNELGPAIREFRLTLAALAEIVRRMEENPAGYLLGRDRIKEFQP
ncbi:MAG: MCE family protein [Deltaproteobacteria bacterium]|nr:MCE family protein [Deltaproteobacteria bacterium]